MIRNRSDGAVALTQARRPLLSYGPCVEPRPACQRPEYLTWNMQYYIRKYTLHRSRLRVDYLLLVFISNRGAVLGLISSKLLGRLKHRGKRVMLIAA